MLSYTLKLIDHVKIVLWTTHEHHFYRDISNKSWMRQDLTKRSCLNRHRRSALASPCSPTAPLLKFFCHSNNGRTGGAAAVIQFVVSPPTCVSSGSVTSLALGSMQFSIFRRSSNSIIIIMKREWRRLVKVDNSWKMLDTHLMLPTQVCWSVPLKLCGLCWKRWI